MAYLLCPFWGLYVNSPVILCRHLTSLQKYIKMHISYKFYILVSYSQKWIHIVRESWFSCHCRCSDAKLNPFNYIRKVYYILCIIISSLNLWIPNLWCYIWINQKVEINIKNLPWFTVLLRSLVQIFYS